MKSAAYLREKAAQCRRLAAGLSSTEPARTVIIAMAEEFDAKLAAAEADRTEAVNKILREDKTPDPEDR